MMSPTCSPVCPGIRGVILCTVLLSGLCSCLYDYYFVNEAKNWTEAQSFCRKYYIDLATVNSMNDMDRLIAAVGSGYSGTVWIGLRDYKNSWKWSMSGDDIYRKDRLNFTKWATGEPSDYRHEHVCVHQTHGFWYDFPCSWGQQFVCYEKSGPPNSPSETYVLIREQKTWYEAQTYCRLHHTDLVSIRDEAEAEVVKQVTEGGWILIGLNRHPWVWWSDGAPPKFSYWLSGHPAANTGDCATSVISATHLGKWVEHDCSLKFPFMCYGKRGKQLFRFKVTALKSTIDLNDPAVTEAILKQMEDKMKEKGFTTGYKLSWIKKPGKNIFNKEEEET